MRRPAFFRAQSSDVDATWSDGADRPIAEALEGHAAGPLSPDEETLTRMKAAVRAAFADSLLSRNAALAADAGVAGGASAGRRIWPQHRRRAFASVCAVAILTLSSVGFVGAESNPGQPFYRLRLGIEAVSLPFGAQPSPLDASLSRADARLTEVVNAASTADWNAAADAADAYREALASITLPNDPTARASVLQRLDQQLGQLEQLRGSSHPPETAVLDKAIAALCTLIGVPVPTPTPAPATPSPATGGNGAAATAQGGAKAGDTARSGSTHRPNSTGTSASRSGDPDGEHATPTPNNPDDGGRFGGGGDRPRR
jgi:hypothetical protein